MANDGQVAFLVNSNNYLSGLFCEGDTCICSWLLKKPWYDAEIALDKW